MQLSAAGHLAKHQALRHMAERESGGRLRLLTGSGPEGSSPGGLRRVARLLIHWIMPENPKVKAAPWRTPFHDVHPDSLSLVRVTYPSVEWISKVDGTSFDLSDLNGGGLCEIVVFSEVDRTAYRVSADASSVRIFDEVDLPHIEIWSEGTGGAAFRLTGSDLHKSVGSAMNDERPSYCIATGWDCVEFICLNKPEIECLGEVPKSSKSFH